MARRDIFRNISQAPLGEGERDVQPGFTSRGASRSMISSIGELAAQAARVDKLIEGKTIQEFDPEILVPSFMRDRLDEDEQAMAELEQAIKERGQDSPILVRPHPTQPEHYQIVFGHRRTLIAKRLGRKVRAVVTSLSDQEHVIAQGQENSARANLSFIERAQFAENLLRDGYSKELVLTALTIDAPMLTRMISVVSRVPRAVLAAIGAAPGIGRDKWLKFATLIENPARTQAALEYIETEFFKALAKEQRFDQLALKLSSLHKSRGKKNNASSWQSADGQLGLSFMVTGKTTQIALSQKQGRSFGAFLANQIDRLYEEFKLNETKQITGD